MQERTTVPGLTVVMAALLTACAPAASTGYLGGLLSVSKQPAKGLELVWTADQSGVRGTITTALPSGERFKGNFVQVTQEIPDTELVPMVNPIAGFTDAVAREGGTALQDVWANAAELGWFRTEYANRIVAVLFGDKGNAMRCGFRLFDPAQGFRGGGTGTCAISFDNGTVAVQF
jgi:hypothetical protein